MTAPAMPTLIRGDARCLPLADNTVDLIVTSPPYFGLRSYQDGGEHYDGQLGSEATPREFVDALIDCTREMMRVLKPTGSIWLNLGDKYSGYNNGSGKGRTLGGPRGTARVPDGGNPHLYGVPVKSLMLVPERFRIAAVDDLGLIARAVIVWSKPNGLPESVTDRVRRSHEDWVHLTKQPRYYSAVDEIREPASDYARPNLAGREARGGQKPRAMLDTCNPLGKLPGSVWEIATQPLKVPAELGIEHYAAFPSAWPRRLILGWSPREVCTVCGEGRRPVSASELESINATSNRKTHGGEADDPGVRTQRANVVARKRVTITGYACACPDTSAPSTPGVVLDPFGGTGTTGLVAAMLGRTGISVDLSADYCRLAEWRANDPKERARAAGVDAAKVESEVPGQTSIFDLGGDAA